MRSSSTYCTFDPNCRLPGVQAAIFDICGSEEELRLDQLYNGLGPVAAHPRLDAIKHVQVASPQLSLNE